MDDYQECYRQEILGILGKAMAQIGRVRSYAEGDLRVFDSIEWHILLTAANDCAEAMDGELNLLEADIERLRSVSV
jgi:hypothetical protein